MTTLPLLLASASPRRAELLLAAGIPFDVQVADIDESRLTDETPQAYVARLSLGKAEAVQQRHPNRVILGADTAVVVDEHLFGKPVDEADARRMIGLLSGRIHLVMTGVSVVAPIGPARDTPSKGRQGRPRRQVEVVSTAVEFRVLTAEEIDWYVASGEPLDKAGGYAIQGLASRFVTRIDGSYSNVVGLPVALVTRMCMAAGMLLF